MWASSVQQEFDLTHFLLEPFSSLLCVHQDTRLFCEVLKDSRCTNKTSSSNPFAHCFVNMARDCFVRYMQGFGMSPIRCPMMPLDTHTPCISNSYKCSPQTHTFIEELFNHAGCCCCCWPGTTSGLLLSFNGVHRLVSEVLMLYCPFQLVWNQIVTWVGTSRSQKVYG